MTTALAQNEVTKGIPLQNHGPEFVTTMRAMRHAFGLHVQANADDCKANYCIETQTNTVLIGQKRQDGSVHVVAVHPDIIKSLARDMGIA